MLSAQEARWLAIEAQGLASPRPARVTRRHVLDAVRRLGALQLDAINVVDRTQYLVLFARLGAYDKAALHDLIGPQTEVWEYWGHAASLQPVTDEPLFRWRYDIGGTYHPGPRVQARKDAWRAANADYIDAVLDEVRERGPLSARQLSDPRPRSGEWWGRRSVGRQALEYLFGHGVLTGWRLPSFEQVYDLRERALPRSVLDAPTPSVDAAHRALLLKAAAAYGVATTADLAGYFMLKVTAAKLRIAELVEDGELVTVGVEGWTEPAYCLPKARPRPPARATGALLSPFDSMIWDRVRTQRVFGFDYRIEVYFPAPKRVHGYYVLPFLLGDRLVGRFDLKADRRRSTLQVVAAHLEADADWATVKDAAHIELDAMCAWLGLDAVTWPA